MKPASELIKSIILPSLLKQNVSLDLDALLQNPDAFRDQLYPQWPAFWILQLSRPTEREPVDIVYRPPATAEK
jgi:hypothetical protein